MQEIERKFLIKKKPTLKDIKKISYERYFLYKDLITEIRIQKKGENYEFERKVNLNNLSCEKQKFKISKNEFEALRKLSSNAIIRESYRLSSHPNISITLYKGKYKGLERVEVEFDNEKEAKDFIPFDWFGYEITNSPLGRDSKIINLSEEEFQNYLLKK